MMSIISNCDPTVQLQEYLWQGDPAFWNGQAPYYLRLLELGKWADDSFKGFPIL